MSKPELILTSLDYERLTELLSTVPEKYAAAAEQLDAELCRARVVAPEEVPPNVVTMNSRVRFEEVATGVQRELRLCYPDDASKSEDAVSVLAPIGSALLGLRVGQTIEWPLPGDRHKLVRILEVTYQPEASGKLDE